MAIILNKKKVYTKLQNEKAILYNYITNILLDRIFNKVCIADEKIYLISSKRETNKFLNENFKNYLKIQNKNKLNLDVLIKTPSEEKNLQIADFVSWAIFRKYEKNDLEYYNIFRNKVIEENSLFS